MWMNKVFSYDFDAWPASDSTWVHMALIFSESGDIPVSTCIVSPILINNNLYFYSVRSGAQTVIPLAIQCVIACKYSLLRAVW